MRPSTIWYILKQGFINIRRNWMFSVASVLTMTACIFLFGIFYSLIVNVNYIAKKTEEKIPIAVFFEEGTTQEELDEVEKKIRERPEVEDVVFVSGDEGLENYLNNMYPDGDEMTEEVKESFKDLFLEYNNENPLENSYNFQVTVKEIERQDELVSYIRTLPHVRKVRQSSEAANTLSSFNRILYYVSSGIIGILLLISVFLISNTISVGISVRKEEIGIMKYIGATDRFVRAPFVLEGIFLGIIGAIIPLTLLYFLYIRAIRLIVENFSVLGGSMRFLSVAQSYRTLLPIGLLLGIGIGWIGSFLTTRKHLRV